MSVLTSTNCPFQKYMLSSRTIYERHRITRESSNYLYHITKLSRTYFMSQILLLQLLIKADFYDPLFGPGQEQSCGQK